MTLKIMIRALTKKELLDDKDKKISTYRLYDNTPKISSIDY